MVEISGEPRVGLVAHVALGLGHGMIRRLADRVYIVMARLARAEDCIVVHLGERYPGCGTVAVVADVRAEHVVSWLGARCDGAARCMAAAAIDWRALENAGNVAGLAIDRQVSAVELEAGGDVVEA